MSAQATVKTGLTDQFRGGVIMDVVTAEQARIAQDAGATAVMALERVPADIRAEGGIARSSAPELIESIIEAVDVPVMAKVRIGHFVEAQILETLGVDFIDESECCCHQPTMYTTSISGISKPHLCAAQPIWVKRYGVLPKVPP